MSVFVRYFNVYKKIWFGRKLGKMHIERSPLFEIKVPGKEGLKHHFILWMILLDIEKINRFVLE